MATQALINRERKRASTVSKYSEKRKALFDVIHDNELSDEERFAARLKLQALPRNASPVRQRRRCALTGRSRGVFRKFGLGRSKLREVALNGEIPGVVKASW